ARRASPSSPREPAAGRWRLAASGRSHLPKEFDMIARFVVASVVLMVGGFSAGGGKEDGKKDDKGQLQGERGIGSAELPGKKAEGLTDKKLIVKGDEWIPPSAGPLKFKFKLDAAKNPKQLDLMADLGGNEQTWPGIYKIEGDTFTFCRSAGPGGER